MPIDTADAAACLAEIRSRLALQQELRPEMAEEDVVKFVFQGMLGVGHLVDSPEAARARLEAEYNQVIPDETEPLAERISTAWIRLNLRPAKAKGMAAGEIAARVFQSAQMRPFSFTRRDVYDFCLQVDPGDRMKKAAALILDKTRLPSHSDAYREAYRPAYRVLYDPRNEM